MSWNDKEKLLKSVLTKNEELAQPCLMPAVDDLTTTHSPQLSPPNRSPARFLHSKQLLTIREHYKPPPLPGNLGLSFGGPIPLSLPE